MIVLPNTGKKDAVLVAERIRTHIFDQSFFPNTIQPDKRLSVSTGISMYPSEAATVDELIKKADIQLYRAKQEGKNRVCYEYEAKSGGLETMR